ncbi:MAG: hypothetical protein HY461_00910 [Parcubacteria group bacterium]|nr:hypothetical protein [Parcubacteria group bacterium]
MTKTLEPKDIVKAAYEYLLKVSADAAKYSNFRVEEFETKNKNFVVTLSYEFVGEFPFERKREYKDFVIDEQGQVLSMKIRKI